MDSEITAAASMAVAAAVVTGSRQSLNARRRTVEVLGDAGATLATEIEIEIEIEKRHVRS